MIELNMVMGILKYVIVDKMNMLVSSKYVNVDSIK